MGAMDIFDRPAVRRHRDRAAPRVHRVAPILTDSAHRLLDRLDDTKVRFTRALEVGGRGVVAPLLRSRGLSVVSCDLSARMAALSGPSAVAMDEEWVPFAPGSFDLIVANLSLHWVNDLPGTLIQLRRTLTNEGLLLASFPVLGTLAELRTALTHAELAASGGASPRVSPFPDLRDLAGLMQRAGYHLPVADLETITLSYAHPMALLHDLRDAGETNATRLRARTPLPAFDLPGADRHPITLRIGTVTGWSSPSPSGKGSG